MSASVNWLINALGDGLVANKHQAITWTNDNPIYAQVVSTESNT